MMNSSPSATSRIDAVANQPYKRKAPQVDARHALRLVDVMEEASEDRAVRVERNVEIPVSRPTPSVSPKPKTQTRPKKITLPPLTEGGFVSATIASLRREDKGQSVTVTLILIDDLGERHREDVKILWVSCQDLGLSEGEISTRDLKEIHQAGQRYMAVLQSMTYLGYGSMSRRKLEQKLTLKGYDREVAIWAVAYVAERGYLEESDTAMRFAERGLSKSWGPRRIKEDLFARGFPASVVAEVMEALEEVDFVTPCADYLQRKYGGVPKDPATRRKVAAALMRMGYTADIIAKAMGK